MINKSVFLIVFLISALFITYGGIASAEVLTFSQGLHLAAQNNRLVKISERDEAISEADITLARALMLPSINASLSQTFLAYQPGAIFVSQTPVPGSGSNTSKPLTITTVQEVPTAEKNFASYSLTIQQLLYDFERSSSLYKASSLIAETKKLDTMRIKNLVSLEFSFAYFDLLETEKMVRVVEKEAESLLSHLKDAKNLYEEGVITRNDLLQAEVRLSDTRQRLVSVKNLREITAARLNNILARPFEEGLQVMDVSDAPSDGLELEMKKMWPIAERRRTEIKILDKTLDAMNLEERAKKSGYYPWFFVQGGYDHTDNSYQTHEGNWSLSIGMRLNLFSGGSTKAEVSKIGNEKLKILEQRDKIVDEIKLEVEKYIIDLRTAKEKIAVTSDAIQQAEENLRINRVRYEEGVGTATEVLDAVTLFTVAETNYYRSVYDFKRAEAGMMYSIGRDLREVYK